MLLVNILSRAQNAVSKHILSAHTEHLFDTLAITEIIMS